MADVAPTIPVSEPAPSAAPPEASWQPQRVSRDERPESDLLLGRVNNNPKDIGFFALLREDLRTHDNDLFSQGFWAVAVHRFGNWRMGVPTKLLRLPFTIAYKMMYKWVEWTCGISLAYTVKVGRRVHIWHHGGMILGARSIGNDVHIRQNTTFGVARRNDPRWMKPVIEDRADIGTGAVIVGGITIGHDAKVGANAVVTIDVPPHHIAVGVPAVVKPPKAKSG
jgi:serine O-acetyltransferase